MDGILDDFRTIAASLTYHRPAVPVVSTLTGTTATPEQLTSPDYWTDHIRGTVRFHDAVTTLRTQGTTTFLEVGPDASLASLAQASLTEPHTTAIPLQRANHPEPQTLLSAVARAHTTGTPVDLATLTPAPNASPFPPTPSNAVPTGRRPRPEPMSGGSASTRSATRC